MFVKFIQIKNSTRAQRGILLYKSLIILSLIISYHSSTTVAKHYNLVHLILNETRILMKILLLYKDYYYYYYYYLLFTTYYGWNSCTVYDLSCMLFTNWTPTMMMMMMMMIIIIIITTVVPLFLINSFRKLHSSKLHVTTTFTCTVQYCT
jgi:hypothetical protein